MNDTPENGKEKWEAPVLDELDAELTGELGGPDDPPTWS